MRTAAAGEIVVCGKAARGRRLLGVVFVQAIGLAIVTLGGALVATSSLQPITPFAIAGYALLTGAAAVRVSRGEGFVTIPIAWAAYPVMHLAHGVGFGTGLVRALARPDWGPEPRMTDPKPA